MIRATALILIAARGFTLVASAGCAAEDEPAADGTNRRIEQAILMLADDSFTERERATLELIDFGMAAIAPVARAVESADIEVSSRAARILLAMTENADEKTSGEAIAAMRRLTESKNRAAARRAALAVGRYELRKWAEEQSTVAAMEEAHAVLDRNDAGRVIRANLAFCRGAGKVLKLLPRFDRLERIDLSGAEVCDDDLAHLAKLTGLVELKLIHTSITGTGLTHLRLLSRLETLNLFASEVDDEGLEHLRGLGQLKVLNLSATHVTEEGIADLTKALPDCRIVWDGR